MNKKSEIRIILKYMTFMKIAESLGDLSYDEKHQVGAILAKKNFKNITAIGYNGNYSGGANERDSMESGMSGYLHAEENMIGNTALSEEVVEQYYRAFVTMTPCNMCAKRLLGKGIKEIIYLNEYINCGDTFEIFEKGGAECKTLESVVGDLFEKTSYYIELVNTLNEDRLEDDMSPILNSMLNRQIKETFELEISKKKYLSDYKDVYYLFVSDKEGWCDIKSCLISRYKKAFFETLYKTLKKTS